MSCFFRISKIGHKQLKSVLKKWNYSWTTTTSSVNISICHLSRLLCFPIKGLRQLPQMWTLMFATYVDLNYRHTLSWNRLVFGITEKTIHLHHLLHLTVLVHHHPFLFQLYCLFHSLALTSTKSGFRHTCWFSNGHTVRYLCDETYQNKINSHTWTHYVWPFKNFVVTRYDIYVTISIWWIFFD